MDDLDDDEGPQNKDDDEIDLEEDNEIEELNREVNG